MTVFLVDTSAWSLAYRHDTDPQDRLVLKLRDQLSQGNVVTTGVVYLELRRGFTTEAGRATIDRDLAVIPFIEADRDDYAAAADLCVTCRRAGVQLTTIDALIAQLCISRDLALLTADDDFVHAARHVPLQVWAPR